MVFYVSNLYMMNFKEVRGFFNKLIKFCEIKCMLLNDDCQNYLSKYVFKYFNEFFKLDVNEIL